MLAGLPLFGIALADPATPLSRREVTRPGRRISLMIDGSSSMLAPFAAAHAHHQGRADGGHVLHVGGRRRALRAPADGRAVPRPRVAHRVRRHRLRHHAVHDRLRQHQAEPVAHRQHGRVGELPRSRHRHRAGGRTGGGALPRLRLPRRLGQPDGDLQRRRRRRGHRVGPQHRRRAVGRREGQGARLLRAHQQGQQQAARRDVAARHHTRPAAASTPPPTKAPCCAPSATSTGCRPAPSK